LTSSPGLKIFWLWKASSQVEEVSFATEDVCRLSLTIQTSFGGLLKKRVLKASKIGHHVRKLSICQPRYITRFITQIDFSAVIL
jgi:hypothetical protein